MSSQIVGFASGCSVKVNASTKDHFKPNLGLASARSPIRNSSPLKSKSIHVLTIIRDQMPSKVNVCLENVDVVGTQTSSMSASQCWLIPSKRPTSLMTFNKALSARKLPEIFKHSNKASIVKAAHSTRLFQDFLRSQDNVPSARWILTQATAASNLMELHGLTTDELWSCAAEILV